MSNAPYGASRSATRHVYYIHGFASSAKSEKAEYFSSRVQKAGVGFTCPDFNEPDFESLTVSRMIDRVEQDLLRLGPSPVALVGSSLGGLVAHHVAARQWDSWSKRAERAARSARVDRLVLLAPALDFCRSESGGFDAAAIARWRETGRLDVLHHGDQAMRSVRYELYEDALQYDSFAVTVPVPTLVFQGSEDELVNPDMVRRFAGSCPHVTLRLLADDHRLTSSLPLIWQECRIFLGLPVA